MSDIFRTKAAKIYPLAFLTLVIFGLISGCNLFPTATPLPPTATATITETPTPTTDWFPATPTTTQVAIPSATPQPTLANLREGITEILTEDDFTNERLWETVQSASGNVAFGNRNLTLAVARKETSLISTSEHTLPANFYLEITVQATLCQLQDQVGIIFLQQSATNYYRLLLTCGGQYRLELVQNGQTIVIKDWESASQFEPGNAAANRLALWVSQGLLQFFINDTFQFEERIARDRDGGLSLFARTTSGSALTVKFSDLQIYRVEAD